MFCVVYPKPFQEGSKQEISLGGLVRLEYAVEDLLDQNRYQLDLSISVCLDASKPCVNHVPIMQKARIPKTLCHWDKGFIIKDFSLDKYLSEHGLNHVGRLSGPPLYQLFETLGIGRYIEDKQCDRNLHPYLSQENGWNSDCPLNVDARPLPSIASCYISERCSAVECCLEAKAIGHTFRTYLTLDPCDFRLIIGIERMKLNISLATFKWGTPQQIYLNGLVQVHYMVLKLDHQKEFLVDLNLSLCYDANKECDFDFPIFVNTSLPMAVCEWQSDFSMKGFSLTHWLSDNHLPSTLTISEPDAHMLLRELGLSDYLLDLPCNRSSHTYIPAMNGWKKQCPVPVELSTLTGPVSCHLMDMCTGFDCCFDVALVQQAFKVYIHLDHCNYKLFVGIEKLQFTVHLHDYEWGTQKELFLRGVVRLAFVLQDLVNENMYEVTASLSVCFESSSPCLIHIPILNGAKLPKQPCTWGTGFALPEFSLQTWLENKGNKEKSSLTADMKSTLLKDLGLEGQLDDSFCVGNLSEGYTSGSIWRNECLRNISLPKLPKEVHCHLDNSCTNLSCCLHLEEIGRKVNFRVNIDTCMRKITLGIEKLTSDVMMFDFVWGIRHRFQLQGLLYMDLLIHDLKAELVYAVNMSIGVCLSDSASCDMIVPVLLNAELPVPSCDWNTELQLKNFSMKSFLQEKSTIAGGHLKQTDAELLLKAMQIYPYLDRAVCQKTSYIGGWNSSCPATIDLPSLPDFLYCNIHDTCSSLDCCFQLPFLERPFGISLAIDPCSLMMKVGIERQVQEISLLNYKWGENETFSLFGAVKLQYQVFSLNNEGVYIVTLNLSTCFDTEVPCLQAVKILHATKLPKRDCLHRKGFQMEDFMTDTWISTHRDKGIHADLESKIIQNGYGIAELLRKTPCNRTAPPYQPSVRGWNTACPMNTTLKLLPQSVSCHISSSCMAIDCCTHMPEIGTSLTTFLHLDPCTYHLEVGIERLRYDVSLLEFDFGKWKEVDLFGVLVTRFSVANKSHLLVSNFDIASWKKRMGFSLDHQLTGLSSDILLNDMNISEYLEKESCQRTMRIFSSAVNNWNSECPGNITLPKLPGPVTCHIPDYCTGISCCVDVRSIGRSFHVYVDIDSCDHRLTVGIEQLHVNISLIGYVWGQKQSLSLKGLVLLEYQLYDLNSEEQFLISSTIKICTANTSCDLMLLVLNNTRLPKKSCGKSLSSNEGFDMDVWLMGRNISSAAVLSNADRLLVMEDMGLAHILKSEQCLQHRPVNLGGWSQDCKFNLSLPELPAGVKCHVSDFCTGISCCLPMETLNRAVEMHLEVDSCNNVLSVGIEKLTRTVSLVAKSSFRRTEIFLNGIIRTEVMIDSLDYEKVVLLNANVSACLNTNHRRCIDLVQLKNIHLLEDACDTRMDYVTPGFSMNEWLKENDFTKMPSLPDHVSSILLEDLKISQFLQSHACDRSKVPYGNSASGWTNDCPANMSLPNLGKEISCYIPGKCTAVDCCMDVGLIGRPVHIVVDINPCQYQMTLEIEDYNRTVSLLEYDWGTVIHMWLGGVIRLE
ncbi:hypothetical protein CHS0354_024512 [Potamilus streckersoni]|uniref:Uncharacterized protein n=1 Tax=Potamilus streckersoni TaxID=2493646 RepID=A0AAE0TNJ6_9BIVA|nr:hypothetical protein CHS0354_024512 [Potamilus streckersoni]